MTLEIKKDVSLATLTTFGIGGRAEYFLSVDNTADMREAVLWAYNEGHAITVLAGGSNVLLNDRGIKGFVLKMDIDCIEYKEKGSEVYVTVGAGTVLDDLVEKLVSREIWGIENLSGIPGSVGAVPIQNVGAYGVGASDCISSVVAYDIEADKFVVFDNNNCGFEYRNSFFKQKENKKYIIVWVTFKLSKVRSAHLSYKDLQNIFKSEREPTIREIRDAVIGIRSKKFPDWSKVGTAGSFFKNPIIEKQQYDVLRKIYPNLPGFDMDDNRVKVPLGWILEHVLSLKGYREKNVGTFDKQALVVVNYSNATAEEVRIFANTIYTKVKETTDINIEWEVTYIDGK